MKDPWLWIKIQSTFRAYISIEEADRLRQLPNFTMPNTIRRIFSEMVPGFAFGFFLIFLDQITDS
jgi:hypothetical protein